VAESREPVGAAKIALEIYPGAKIVAENKPLFCRHCDKGLVEQYQRLYSTAQISMLVALLYQSHGKIVERVWPDRREWACHYCGRAYKETDSQKP
jgi:hypothetical protein